jgi:hypothetical protein
MFPWPTTVDCNCLSGDPDDRVVFRVHRGPAGHKQDLIIATFCDLHLHEDYVDRNSKEDRARFLDDVTQRTIQRFCFTPRRDNLEMELLTWHGRERARFVKAFDQMKNIWPYTRLSWTCRGFFDFSGRSVG